MAFGSKSSSKSYAWDNRSMASDTAIAAGGNSGIVTRYESGGLTFNAAKKTNRLSVGIAAAIGLVIWKFPPTRKLLKRILK